MKPGDAMLFRIRPDVTLEVDIIAFLDVVRVQGTAKGHR
jgi:hypothetical protein